MEDVLRAQASLFMACTSGDIPVYTSKICKMKFGIVDLQTLQIVTVIIQQMLLEHVKSLKLLLLWILAVSASATKNDSHKIWLWEIHRPLPTNLHISIFLRLITGCKLTFY